MDRLEATGQGRIRDARQVVPADLELACGTRRIDPVLGSGVAFLVAAVLRTPGCEMRSLPHLASLALPDRRDFVACPGPLQPLDEWEARTTGRAEPYVRT